MRWRGLVGLVLVAGCSTVQQPTIAPRPSPVARGDYEEGLASWYGPGFNGKRTANGEVYDQEDMTAAHKSLPLGSLVEVENLDNARTLDLRVNDRGPYVKGRIIDLSKGAARILGVLAGGTAPVRVRVLAYGDNKYRKVGRGMIASRPLSRPQVIATAPPPAAAPPTVVAIAPPRSTTPPVPTRAANPPAVPAPAKPVPAKAALREPSYRIQVAHLSDADRAEHLANVLRDRFPAARVHPVTIGERRGFRVEIGPITGHASARAEADRVGRLGYPATIEQAD